MATYHWLTAMGTVRFNPKKNQVQRSVIGYNFHNRTLLRINQVICYYVKQTPQNQFFLFRHRPNATGLHHRQTRANWRQAEIG